MADSHTVAYPTGTASNIRVSSHSTVLQRSAQVAAVAAEMLASALPRSSGASRSCACTPSASRIPGTKPTGTAKTMGAHGDSGEMNIHTL